MSSVATTEGGVGQSVQRVEGVPKVERTSVE